MALASSVGLSVAWFITGMARDIQGGAFDLLPLLTVGQFALVAMPVLLVLSGILTALVASRHPWVAPDVARWRTPVTRIGRLAMGGALAGIVALPALLIGGPITPQASAGNTVCAAGAPQKLYVVRAISLTIPLNRFGDGYRCHWGTMDFWTDNTRGTPDDVLAEPARNDAYHNFHAAAAEARSGKKAKSSGEAAAKKMAPSARQRKTAKRTRKKSG